MMDTFMIPVEFGDDFISGFIMGAYRRFLCLLPLGHNSLLVEVSGMEMSRLSRIFRSSFYFRQSHF